MTQSEGSSPAAAFQSSAVTIRPMTPADLPAVLAIAAACPEAPRWRPADYVAYAEPGLQSPLLRAGFVAELANPSGPGTLAGFAAASFLDESAHPDPDSRCELDSMAVLPDARRRGIGAALLGAILTWAREHRARRLVLEVRAANMAALALYQRFGLREDGSRPRYYADPPEDAVLLGMVVTAGSAMPSFSTEKPVEGGPPRC